MKKVKSPAFKNQFNKSFFFNEAEEVISKVGFDSCGIPCYMETTDKKDLVHLRGTLIDAKYFSYRPE